VPTVGLFHGFYWNLSDTVVPPVVIGRGGYPLWQAAVITPSLFGVIGAWLDHLWAKWQWWWAFYRRVDHLSIPQRAVLLDAVVLFESPAYPAAREAVRETAMTLGFSAAHPQAFLAYSRAIKSDPGRMENTFRHIRAMERTVELLGSTLSNPVKNLVVEFAYWEYQQHPWKVA
jgi:hypothetical protein